MYSATAKVNLTTAADAATGGKCWLQNEDSSPVYMIVRALWFAWDTGMSDATDPTMSLERMTLDTNAGSPIAVCKVLTSDTNPIGILTTAAPNVPVAGSRALLIPPPMGRTATPDLSLSAGLIVPPNPIAILTANEGLVLRQTDPGDASEERQLTVTFYWDEISNGQGSQASVRRYYGPWKIGISP